MGNTFNVVKRIDGQNYHLKMLNFKIRVKNSFLMGLLYYHYLLHEKYDLNAVLTIQ